MSHSSLISWLNAQLCPGQKGTNVVASTVSTLEGCAIAHSCDTSSAACGYCHSEARRLLQSGGSCFQVQQVLHYQEQAPVLGHMFEDDIWSHAEKTCLHDGFGACLRSQLKGHGARAGRSKGPLVPALPGCPGLCQAAYRPWLVHKVLIQNRDIGLLHSTHAYCGYSVTADDILLRFVPFVEPKSKHFQRDERARLLSTIHISSRRLLQDGKY